MNFWSTRPLTRWSWQNRSHKTQRLGNSSRRRNCPETTTSTSSTQTKMAGCLGMNFWNSSKRRRPSRWKKSGAVEAAEVTVEEKAEKRLKALFKQLDTDSDDTVSKEELAAKLNAEDSEFKKDEFVDMLKKAGLQTDLAVVEQLGTNQDGRVTWDEFYAKLHQVATQEIQETGDVVAAPIVMEDETSAKNTCCI